jgi:ATP-dependent exoDNAse (exonuclease V) beta subunit
MINDQSRLDQDAQAREEALKHHSFIVEAPAGSGKTELLTQRYLSLLATVESPEEIIAITFTNKAASEMKKRILDSFSIPENEDQPHKIKTRELAKKVLARSEDLGWNLLQTPSRLRIYTIDSLSGHLARQMPLLSRFGSQPAVCEDASLHYQEAVNRTLANLDNDVHSPTVQAALRYFDNDHYKLTKLLAEMLEKRDQWLPYEKPQDSVALAEAALTYFVAQDMQTLPIVLSDQLQQALMPIACYAASNAILEYGQDHPLATLDGWSDPVRLVPQDLPKWYAIAYLLLKAEDKFREQVDKRNGFPAGQQGAEMKTAHEDFINEIRQIPEAESTLAKLRKLPYPQYDPEGWEIVGTIASLLKLAVAELWLVFQQHGEVDFVEISKQALFALKDAEQNPTDLALKLDYKIQHLLVDEFQDTSPTQIKLIERLTQGWEAGDGRTLFAVGDPMQSIYRFRKANVSLFLRAATHGVGNVRLTPLKLLINNRSERPLIDWINRTFKAVFPDEDSVSRGAISYRECVPKHEGQGEGWTMHAMIDRTKVDVPDEDDEEELLQDDLGQQEAEKIIQIIRETWAEDPKRKIAVLVRARSHLHALVAEIRRKHPKLSFQAVEIEALANRQVVQDLLSLTHALHQRADRVHWLAILRAPWCGLTLKDMHALVGQDKYSTIHSLMHDERRLADLTEDGRRRLLHLRAVVDEALLNRGRMPTARWVQSAWLMLGGPSCLWNPGDIRDVQAFFERIDRMEAMGQFRVELLGQEVEKLYAAPDAQAPDLLQFMTIHKSKGLEFDTVILPGLGKQSGRTDKPLLIWEEVPKEEGDADVADVDLVVAPLPPKAQHKKDQPSPYAYLGSLEKERAAHEDRRVLYVAATRAERHLHLLGTVKLNKDEQLNPTKNTFLETLWPIVSEKFEEALSNPGSTEQGGMGAAKLEDFVPKLVRLANPVIPAVLGGELPPSDVPTSNQDEETVTLKPSMESSIGTLTHRYLELIATHQLDTWTHDQIASLKPVMRHWLAQQGHALEVASAGADMVASLLQKTLESADGRWVLAARAQAGHEQEILFMDNTFVKKRIIDRTFVDSGTRWIVDYKTTAAVANFSEAEIQTEALKHVPQLAEYAALFADEGLPIKTAVFFVNVGRLIEVAV